MIFHLSSLCLSWHCCVFYFIFLFVKYFCLPLAQVLVFSPFLPGQSAAQLKRQKLVCAPKPSDLAQRSKVPAGSVSLANLTSASSSSSVSSSASSASESSSGSLRHVLQRRNPVIPDTVKLPPGVSPQTATSNPAQTHAPPINRDLSRSIRKREQRICRKDSTQSLYINKAECDLLLQFSSCPPSASSSSSSISVVTLSSQIQQPQGETPKVQRRFSDPDIPYMDSDAWPSKILNNDLLKRQQSTKKIQKLIQISEEDKNHSQEQDL